MSETIELDSLVGQHQLSGVDSGNLPNGANTFFFTLDGKTYVATEDESDGYRSSMDSLEITDKVLSNAFQPQWVTGRMTGDGNDVLEFIDSANGKTVLRVGTHDSDNYYPSFVSEFNPENMSVNKVV